MLRCYRLLFSFFLHRNKKKKRTNRPGSEEAPSDWFCFLVRLSFSLCSSSMATKDQLHLPSPPTFSQMMEDLELITSDDKFSSLIPGETGSTLRHSSSFDVFFVFRTDTSVDQRLSLGFRTVATSGYIAYQPE